MEPVTSPQISETAPGAGSRVPLRVHSRALAALGRDLVTDDVVAVMELVKNSYDALATSVDVRIRPAGDSPRKPRLYRSGRRRARDGLRHDPRRVCA